MLASVDYLGVSRYLYLHYEPQITSYSLEN